MDKTAEFILEKVAPIFNKKGYVGTTMSDITVATKLTKGAIYCNFKNKEDLALKAFKHNLKKAIQPLQSKLAKEENSVKKLLILCEYYRQYYDVVEMLGACPLLNAAIDAKCNNNPVFQESKKISTNLISGVVQIIQSGINKGEIKAKVNPYTSAQIIYSMIEGAVFMAQLHQNKLYLINMMDSIEEIILSQYKQ